MRPVVLALPKGRFEESSLGFLKRWGLENSRGRRYRSKTKVDGIDVEIVLLKMKDIGELLARGYVDVALCNDEWISECAASVKRIVDSGWCNASIVLAGNRSTRTVTSVATPFPHIAHKNMAGTEILPVSGSCEGLVPDYADAIVDCIETGTTLEQNGLVVLRLLMDSKTWVCVRSGAAPEADIVGTAAARNVCGE